MIEFSVVIPVFNAAEHLEQTLDSIRAQTVQPLEVIVVDDASTDDSAAIASRYGVRHLLRTGVRGIFSALNAGIHAAQGNVVAFISGDDVWLPDKLALQANILSAQPETDYVFTAFEVFVEPGTVCAGSPRFFPGQVGRSPLLETLAFRKKAFDAVGWFDESFTISGDVEWFARLLSSDLQGITLPDVLVRKRLHNHNASVQNAALTQSELLRALRSRTRRAHVESQKVP